MEPPERGWIVLIYRVPSEPASKRVAVWRELKRLGALYLQQCACIVPRFEHLEADLEQVTRKIASLGGESTRLDVPELRGGDAARIIAAFRELRNKEYAEIVEECETKFVKEVEFEHFRANYTFEEAEEIQQDLEKIRRWFEAVRRRDWFAAEGADAVGAWLERCAELLGQFEEEVYRRAGSDYEAGAPEVPDGLRPAIGGPRINGTTDAGPAGKEEKRRE